MTHLIDQHQLGEIPADQLITIAVEAMRFGREVPPQVISELRSQVGQQTLIEVVVAELTQCQTKDFCLDQQTVIERMSLNSLIDD